MAKKINVDTILKFLFLFFFQLLNYIFFFKQIIIWSILLRVKINLNRLPNHKKCTARNLTLVNYNYILIQICCFLNFRYIPAMLKEVLKNIPKQEPKESGDVGFEDASTGGTSKSPGGKQKATKTCKEESKEPTVKTEVVIEDTSKVATPSLLVVSKREIRLNQKQTSKRKKKVQRKVQEEYVKMYKNLEGQRKNRRSVI